jgi:hypothetical protein
MVGLQVAAASTGKRVRAWLPRTSLVVVTLGIAIVACAPSTRSNVAHVGRWELTARRDVVTHADTSLAIAWASVHPNGASASGLAIACDARYRSGIAVFISANTLLGRDDTYPVSLRFGDAVPVDAVWETVKTGRALSVPEAEQTSFLEALRGNPRVDIEITSSYGRYRYVVDARGLDELLERMPCYAGAG